MSTKEKPSQTSLPLELQRQLDFKLDSKGEWLINDKFLEAGGLEDNEWIPARARVSKDGTRYEVGANVEDIKGILELNRLLGNSTVPDIDSLADFWKDSPTISAKIEEDTLFIGRDIEPTEEGFEEDCDSLYFAYFVVLQAAIRGKTYQEMKEHDFFGSFLQGAEISRENGRRPLFGTGNEQSGEEEIKKEFRPRERYFDIEADNLRDFPIDSYKTSLHGCPTTLTLNGETKKLSPWIIAHNGERNVAILDVHSNFDSDEDKWESERTQVFLPIPEDVDIKTVADLAKLSNARLYMEATNLRKGSKKEEVSSSDREYKVRIEVSENSFTIESEDGSFKLETQTLACTDCKLPYWKFLCPSSDEDEEDSNPYKEFGMHSVSAGGVGGYQCFVEEDGESKLYCYDCVTKLEAKYVESHPNATRSRKIEIARKSLDEMGYKDVKIDETQVWRSSRSAKDVSDLLTYIEYQREGRTIRRYTGSPLVDDDGGFDKGNLFSRELVDFRYKA